MSTIDQDIHGMPVMLADPVKTPAAKIPEVVPPKPVTPSARPSTVDHVEWARRQDAVREAAREFEDLTEQDLKERLRGVTSKPLEDGDLAQFRADVRASVLDDLLDSLDQRVRGKLRGRRTVRLAMPNGYLKKALRSLDATEADQLDSRLRSRGWTEPQVKKEFWGRLSPRLVRQDGTDSGLGDPESKS